MPLTWASVHPPSLCSSPICSGFKLVWDWHGLVQGWISPAARSLQVLQLSRAFTDLALSSSASVLVQHLAQSRLLLRDRPSGTLGMQIKVMPVALATWQWLGLFQSQVQCGARNPSEFLF